MLKVKSWTKLARSYPSSIDISVLIPCWHAEETIEGALNSIESQKGLPKQFELEIIIVTDGRIEDKKAIEKWIFEKGDSLRWTLKLISLDKNHGSGKAREIAFDQSSGEFITFLDDDDIWHEDKLNFQWNWHLKNPESLISCHGYEFVPLEKKVSFLNLLLGIDSIATPTIMINKKLWPYKPESLRYSEDWLMLAMASKICPIEVLPKKFAWRSKNAPPIKLDKYSLSRRRVLLRLGKIRSIYILFLRGKISFIWLPILLVWNIILFLRRFVMDALY